MDLDYGLGLFSNNFDFGIVVRTVDRNITNGKHLLAIYIVPSSQAMHI